MKVTERTFETKEYTVDLPTTEGLGLKIRDCKFVLAWSIASQRLNFYLEGSLLEHPVFSISYGDLLGMNENGSKNAEYIRLTIPAKFYPKIKKLLKDFPIPLP